MTNADTIYSLKMAIRSLANRLSITMGEHLKQDKSTTNQHTYEVVEGSFSEFMGLRRKLVKEMGDSIVTIEIPPMELKEIDQVLHNLDVADEKELVEPAQPQHLGQLNLDGSVDRSRCDCPACVESREQTRRDGEVKEAENRTKWMMQVVQELLRTVQMIACPAVSPVVVPPALTVEQWEELKGRATENRELRRMYTVREDALTAWTFRCAYANVQNEYFLNGYDEVLQLMDKTFPDTTIAAEVAREMEEKYGPAPIPVAAETTSPFTSDGNIR